MGMPAGLLEQKPIEVEIEDNKFHLRMLSAAEVMAFLEFKKSTPEPDSAMIMARLLGYAMCDETGKRCMTDEEALQHLPQVPAARLAAIFNEALAHSRLDKESQETAEKNSGRVGSKSSPSA